MKSCHMRVISCHGEKYLYSQSTPGTKFGSLHNDDEREVLVGRVTTLEDKHHFYHVVPDFFADAHRGLTMLSLFSFADAHRALELLEEYHTRLDKVEDRPLRIAIERVIRIFKSRLFQALLGRYQKCTLIGPAGGVQVYFHILPTTRCIFPISEFLFSFLCEWGRAKILQSKANCQQNVKSTVCFHCSCEWYLSWKSQRLQTQSSRWADTPCVGKFCRKLLVPYWYLMNTVQGEQIWACARVYCRSRPVLQWCCRSRSMLQWCCRSRSMLQWYYLSRPQGLYCRSRPVLQWYCSTVLLLPWRKVAVYCCFLWQSLLASDAVQTSSVLQGSEPQSLQYIQTSGAPPTAPVYCIISHE